MRSGIVERSSRIFQRKLLCGDMDELETAIATGTCPQAGSGLRHSIYH